MPKGKCSKCSQESYGWALNQPEHQACECGGKIEIKEK